MYAVKKSPFINATHKNVAIIELLKGKKNRIIVSAKGSPPNNIKNDLLPYFDFELSDRYPTRGSVTASIILPKINANINNVGVNSGFNVCSFAGGK